MLVTAEIEVLMIKKSSERNVSSEQERTDSFTFDILKKHEERFIKAKDDQTKKLIIQGYLQSSVLDKLLTEKYGDIENRYYWKKVKVLDFNVGEAKEEIEEVEETPKKKTSKKRII